MASHKRPPSALISGIESAPLKPRQVSAELRTMLENGARLRIAGDGKLDPDSFLLRYPVRHKLQLFGTHFFLSDMAHDDYLNFMVAYVGVENAKGHIKSLHPRIFYKDASLVWRVASHFISTDDEHWIGKGDVRWEQRTDGDYITSAEETTNLPYEMQSALDHMGRRRKSRFDGDAIHQVLRRGSPSRTHPFADFIKPRKLAAESFQINRGRPVARFRKKGDPESLVHTPGFEPDFSNGLIEEQISGSRLYGGALTKYRFLSSNRQIQYQVVASPTHVFINHPQTLTTDLMNYGTRTLDVIADDDAFLPGFEYHFMDDSTDPPTLYSQIPKGFVGVVGVPDSERADAGPWIEALPTVRAFRRQVLGQ